MTALPAEEAGLSLPILIVIIVVVALIFIPIAVWLTINMIAKLCPNSGCGKRLNEWKANRALTDEQKQLQAFQKQKQKMGFVNATNGSDEISHNDVIVPSSAKQRNMNEATRNKVYPLTDVDDNNASVANVGPAGLMSADEQSVEGSRRNKLNFKSRIGIVGYRGTTDTSNVIDGQTVDGIDDTASMQNKKMFGGYQFGKTQQSLGFNTGTTS